MYISSKLKNNNPNKSAILNTFLLLTGKHTLNKLDRFLKNILYIRLCNTHIFQSTVCIAYITFNLVITDVDSSEFADNIHDDLMRRDFTINAMAFKIDSVKIFKKRKVIYYEHNRR